MRNLLLVAVAANTVGMTSHMTYMYYLAPIALRAAGLGGDALIFSLVAVAMGAAVVPAGRLADRIPRRYVLRVGLGLLSVAYLGVAVPLSLAAIVAGTVASGVGLALLFVSFQSYVADLLRAEQRTAAYGRAAAYAILASAAGPALAALVFRASGAELVGLRVNAALFALAGLAAILVTLTLPSVRAPTHTPAEWGHWYEAARAAGPIALLYVFMGAGYGMTAPYFTVYFLDHAGFANDAWGVLLAAGTVASAAGSVAAGELGRRTDARRVAVVGMLGVLAATLLFLFPFGLAWLAVGFLLRSAFSTTVAPGMTAALMERAREARRAETQAYSSLAWNAGWAVGGASGGALLASVGGALFPLGSAIALVGVVAGAVLLRRD
ncbi:MAG TPA: MFS transporter [Candidatus Thermoplasmatota archaeon]|nr:MFS transporter [Candidatus Thermoplasmatota archaeon]